MPFYGVLLLFLSLFGERIFRVSRGRVNRRAVGLQNSIFQNRMGFCFFALEIPIVVKLFQEEKYHDTIIVVLPLRRIHRH
jgi:hypothetical protein